MITAEQARQLVSYKFTRLDNLYQRIKSMAMADRKFISTTVLLTDEEAAELRNNGFAVFMDENHTIISWDMNDC